MTQSYNLSRLANRTNSSGQISLATDIANAVPIANGGTNNASLATTAGGVVYADGSKLVNTGAGTSGQLLRSNGASAPTWATQSSNSITLIASGTAASAGVSSWSVSGLNLTSYKFLWITGSNLNGTNATVAIRLGTSFASSLSNANVHNFFVFLDLTYGICMSWIGKPVGGTSASLVYGQTGINSSSTAITFSIATALPGTFTANIPYRIYGQV